MKEVGANRHLILANLTTQDGKSKGEGRPNRINGNRLVQWEYARNIAIPMWGHGGSSSITHQPRGGTERTTVPGRCGPPPHERRRECAIAAEFTGRGHASNVGRHIGVCVGSVPAPRNH